MREVYISLKNTRKTQTNIWRIQTIERITIHWKNFKENYLNTLNKKSDIHCFVLSSQMEAAQARWLFEPVVCGFPEGRDREWQHQSWDPRRGHSRKLGPCSQAARHITIKKKMHYIFLIDFNCEFLYKKVKTALCYISTCTWLL